MQLWAAQVLELGGQPPFADNEDMFNLIDSIPLGDAPWNSLSVSYCGEVPQGEVPSWMADEYKVHYRDPRTLLHQVLSNTEFDGKCDYAAFKEFGAQGEQQFSDFMSGNWAWEVSVRFISYMRG